MMTNKGLAYAFKGAWWLEGFCRPSVEAGSAARRQAVQRRQRRLPTVVITKHRSSAGSAAQAASPAGSAGSAGHDIPPCF